MRAELNLPDLPEVPIQLGPLATTGSSIGPRGAPPLGLRVRDALSAYLPLLLMAGLALATWWLVKSTPPAPEQRPRSSNPGVPDYTMEQFALERFGADGRLLLRVQGERLRHFPDADRIEADRATIRAFAPDGRETLATAAQAVSSGDGRFVELSGGAQVLQAAQQLRINSEHLYLDTQEEIVKTDRTVELRLGDGHVVRAAGLHYSHATQRLELAGPLRATLLPGSRLLPGGAATSTNPGKSKP
jgi:lipopolysaccharide export system protein LptC